MRWELLLSSPPLHLRFSHLLAAAESPQAEVEVDPATGKPCQVRACKKAKRLNKAFFASSSTVKQPPPECPLDVDELGNATWRFLHTTAAYYPHEPTEEQKQWALQLIYSTSWLYACPHCAPDFRLAALAQPVIACRDEIAKNPPRVNSRREFVE